MKKTFELPEVELHKFCISDVITTSEFRYDEEQDIIEDL